MRNRNTLLGAVIGFALLAAYIVIPDGNKYGWTANTLGYLVGTGIGAGIVGAIVGGLIGSAIGRRKN